MVKGKRKGKRRNEFVGDVPPPGGAREFEDLLASLGPDGLKARIAESPRDVLDKWVTEVAGMPSHESRSKEFVAESLGRWIDGDKNWGYEPPRNPSNNGGGGGDGTEESTTHAQAETPQKEEEEMNATPKQSTDTERKGKKEKAKTRADKRKEERKNAAGAKPPGTAREKTIGKGSTLPIGKTSKKTRASYILDLLIQNRKEKLPDTALLAKAMKEFDGNLVPGPSGTFTIAHQRGVANKDRLLGKRGLKKTEPEFIEYGKTPAKE